MQSPRRATVLGDRTVKGFHPVYQVLEPLIIEAIAVGAEAVGTESGAQLQEREAARSA